MDNGQTNFAFSQLLLQAELGKKLLCPSSLLSQCCWTLRHWKMLEGIISMKPLSSRSARHRRQGHQPTFKARRPSFIEQLSWSCKIAADSRLFKSMKEAHNTPSNMQHEWQVALHASYIPCSFPQTSPAQISHASPPTSSNSLLAVTLLKAYIECCHSPDVPSHLYNELCAPAKTDYLFLLFRVLALS